MNREQLTEELAFLTLKDAHNLPTGCLAPGTDMPLLQRDLVKGLQGGSFSKGVHLENFLRGYAALGAVNETMAQNEAYAPLYSFIENHLPQVLGMFKATTPKDLYRHLLRGLSRLYGARGLILLHELAEEEEDLKERMSHLAESDRAQALFRLTQLYERLEGSDEEKTYANHRLSYLYAATSQWIKAELIEEKVLQEAQDLQLKQEAREHLEELRDGANLERSSLALERHDTEGARNYLSRLSQQVATGIEAYLLLIDSYIQEGNWERGFQILLEGKEHFPEQEDLLRRSAFLHGQLGQFDEAIKEYEILHEAHPEEPETTYNLGMLAMAKGEQEKALAYLREVQPIYNHPQIDELIKDLEY